MTLTIRGVDAIGGTLTMPLRGPWVYTGDIDSQSVATGHADLAYQGPKKAVTFSGTIVESATEAARTRVRMVGGAGGLSRVLPSLGYRRGTPASTVVRDIAVACGESLAEGVTTELAAFVLNGWSREKGTGNRALESLCEHLGLNYRTLANGSLWVGKESWPAFVEPFLEKAADENGVAIYAPDQPDVVPGVNLGGKRVSNVRHAFDGSLRSHVTLLKDLNATGDREKKAQEGFVRSKLPELERMPQYEATVISQEADGSVEVKSDDDRVGSQPDVPLFMGLPGTTVVLGRDVRIKIGFDGAKADRRYGIGFHQDCEAESITIRVGTIIIEADEVLLGGAGGRVVRAGDLMMLPVGPAATPTPMPLAFAPSVVMAGDPGVGFSVVKA